MGDYDTGSTGVGKLHISFAKREDLVELPIANNAQLINGYRAIKFNKQNTVGKSRIRNVKAHIAYEKNYKIFKRWRDKYPNAKGSNLKRLYEKISMENGVAVGTLSGKKYEYKWRDEKTANHLQ